MLVSDFHSYLDIWHVKHAFEWIYCLFLLFSVPPDDDGRENEPETGFNFIYVWVATLLVFQFYFPLISENVQMRTAFVGHYFYLFKSEAKMHNSSENYPG